MNKISNRKKRRNRNRNRESFTQHKRRQETQDDKGKKRLKKFLNKGYVIITNDEAAALGRISRSSLIKGIQYSAGTHLFVAPQWSTDLIDHPDISEAMMLKAKCQIEYRKEVVMEARLLKRRIL